MTIQYSAHCIDSNMFYHFFHHFINVYKYYFMAILVVCLQFCIHIRSVCVYVCACVHAILFLVKLDVRIYSANLKYDKNMEQSLVKLIHFV